MKALPNLETVAPQEAGKNGPKNGREWPEEWPEMARAAATAKMSMDLSRLRRAAYTRIPRISSPLSNGGRAGHGSLGRDRLRECGASFMSGYARKSPGYARALLNCRKCWAFSHASPAQIARISYGLGFHGALPDSPRPWKNSGAVVVRDQPVRMHTTRISNTSSMPGYPT
jgi:hypothetical protein